MANYSKGSTNVSYKYNTDGLRTEKNVNGTVYKYTWSDDKLTHQSWNNKYLHFYYDNSGEAIGFTYYNGTSDSDYTYVKNQNGDVWIILDGSGNINTIYTYDAWGNVLTSSGGSMENINPIRYRSYYYDNEIDMYYLQSRYYDQNVGRFINADDVIAIEAVGFAIPTNMYSYCDNDFVNSLDPSGYWKWKNRKYAVCEPGDTKWGLAKEITGNGNNSKLLSKKAQDKKLYKGTKINILPLLYIWYQNQIKKNCSNQNNAYTASFNGKTLNITVKVLFHNIPDDERFYYNKRESGKRSVRTGKRLKTLALKGIRSWGGNYSNVLGRHNIVVKIKTVGISTTDNLEKSGYVNLYLDEADEVYYGSPHVSYSVPNTNLKKYRMVLYSSWENFANTARHEFGHCLGLNDANCADEWDPAYYAYGLEWALAMRNDGNPKKQEISMIIVGLAENKNQNFATVGDDKISNALRLFYDESKRGNEG